MTAASSPDLVDTRGTKSEEPVRERAAIAGGRCGRSADSLTRHATREKFPTIPATKQPTFIALRRADVPAYVDIAYSLYAMYVLAHASLWRES